MISVAKVFTAIPFISAVDSEKNYEKFMKLRKERAERHNIPLTPDGKLIMKNKYNTKTIGSKNGNGNGNGGESKNNNHGGQGSSSMDDSDEYPYGSHHTDTLTSPRNPDYSPMYYDEMKIANRPSSEVCREFTLRFSEFALLFINRVC